MILHSLHIERTNNWDDKCTGPLIGKIKFKNQDGSIEIRLTPEAVQKMLAIVAEGMVAASQEVATRLTAAVVMQTTPALEHRK